MFDDAVTPPAVWAAPDEPARPALEGEEACDLAIVGGGLVGLTAADVAIRHGLSVMLVEADVVGSGASGANAAGVAPVWGAQTPDGVEAVLGQERGAILNAALAVAGTTLIERARAMPTDCGADGGGFLALAAKEETAASLVGLADQWRRAGADVALLGTALADHVQSPRYVEGLLFASGGTLNPRAYVRGLARQCERQGVRVFEKSPVVGIRRQTNGRWTVESGAGRLDAATVVMAVHGGARTGWGLDRVGWRIDCLLIGSAPLTEAQRQALPRASTFADLDDATVFGGSFTTDRRIVATVLPGPGQPSLAEAASVYADKFARSFPGIALPQWNSLDRGHILITSDKLPQLLELGPGLFAGQGCNGYGLCAGLLLGEDLARLALRRPDMPPRFALESPRRSRLARIAPALVRRAVPFIRRFA
jgi:glycine/D-amino acid oxidase-like deaminating enzyme